jgi:hypothetical protein
MVHFFQRMLELPNEDDEMAEHEARMGVKRNEHKFL